MGVTDIKDVTDIMDDIMDIMDITDVTDFTDNVDITGSYRHYGRNRYRQKIEWPNVGFTDVVRVKNNVGVMDDVRIMVNHVGLPIGEPRYFREASKSMRDDPVYPRATWVR